MCAKMEENEAIIITGAERFSNYKGYGNGFKWAGPFKDNTPWDSSHNCFKRKIVAIDAAISFFGGQQFTKKIFDRDLLKGRRCDL
jgi:poly(ADP-ribose) glycohydrolase